MKVELLDFGYQNPGSWTLRRGTMGKDSIGEKDQI
jgi:hypothetical protein